MRKIVLIALIGVFSGCSLLDKGEPNTKKDGLVFIPKSASWEQVLDSISPFLLDQADFMAVANSMDYQSSIRPGKYKLIKDETSKNLVARLRAGLQEEVNVRIKNEPTFEHLAGSLSRQLDVDSAELVQALKLWGQETHSESNPEILKQYFLPNTYRFYWSVTPEKFFARMQKEYNAFWNEKRKQQAKESGMTPLEITTLASITQMEAPKADEQARVAQAYLNRLEKGIKLEADPTSLYAYKLQNGFTEIQRVYRKHLLVESPYNTYRVKGLPPAPICLPNGTAIDAVLAPEKHDYIYFCADPDRPGYHSFASSFAEHEKNAAKYRRWLTENGIR